MSETRETYEATEWLEGNKVYEDAPDCLGCIIPDDVHSMGTKQHPEGRAGLYSGSAASCQHVAGNAETQG